MDINSELKDAQLEIIDGDKTHSANTKGMIWFNRVSDKIKMMFGSENKIIATEDWVESEVTNSETNLKNNGLVTIEQAGTPATPATGEVNVYAKDDGLYYIDDAGVETQLASSSLQKVTDIYTLEVNLRYTSYGTRTAFTVPSGYTWSFCGVGIAGYDGFGGSYAQRRLIFDGKTFGNEGGGNANSSDEYDIAAIGSLTSFGVAGSGTNTGSITVNWPDPTTLAKLTGIVTLYKKQ